MYTLTNLARPIPPATTRHAADNGATGLRHEHRDRDFGTGYGTSSGYASDKRYTHDWGPARFRCT